MEALLYYVTIFGILIGIAFLLARLRVDPVFYWTFFLLGGTYMTVSVWEALNEEILAMTHTYWIDGVARFYWFSLWWMTIGIASLSFLVMYIVYQVAVAHYFVWDKTIALGGLIVGLSMVFGVVEDFGVFTLWGLEHFNLIDAPWHQSYLGPVPTFYLWIIPGLILVGITLWWSTLTQSQKRDLTSGIARPHATCTPDFIARNGGIWQCAPQGESGGYESQLCLTNTAEFCERRNKS